MYNLSKDTIFAISTGAARSAIAVIRISGNQVEHIQNNLIRKKLNARHASLCNIYAYHSDEIIDNALLLKFKAPQSFTGEDMLEMHVHGSRAVINKLHDELSRIKNVRIAEAGEFTFRAFDNEKLKLNEIEALSDLINAETESQRKSAIIQLSNETKNIYIRWREEIVQSLAYIELGIDFVEEDIEDQLHNRVIPKIKNLIYEFDRMVKVSHKGEVLRDGYRVLLIGDVNVGKSSVINRLTNSDIAIVTDIEGTTRDLLEAQIDLNGIKVIITDSAGIRDTEDVVEKAGVKKAIDSLKNCDLVIKIDSPLKRGVDNLDSLAPDENLPILHILNKIDLVDKNEQKEYQKSYDILISAKHGEGINDLLDKIESEAKGCLDMTLQSFIVRTRQRDIIIKSHDYLKRALEVDIVGSELMAEELRCALAELGKITGHVDTEEILGNIFSEFCIGK